jgi:hypothetical protein
MKNIIITSYSSYYDIQTETQFQSILDRSTGCFVGHAVVENEVADAFADRPNFIVMDDAEFAEWSKGESVPVVPTGNPSTEAKPATPAAPRNQKAKPATPAAPVASAENDGPPAPPEN